MSHHAMQCCTNGNKYKGKCKSNEILLSSMNFKGMLNFCYNPGGKLWLKAILSYKQHSGSWF